MNLDHSGFLEKRIVELQQHLLATDGEYAAATARCAALRENIDPIIHQTQSLVISPGDCMDLIEFYQLQSVCQDKLQKHLYRQGYLDCVKVLKDLGILST